MASDYLSNFYAVAKQLTIPPKTILLEEGKVADKLYLIRKGCLRLFFYNDGKDITFQFFFGETGRESRKISGETHGVGVGEEKQAEKPIPEANRYVGERKLGVGAEK